MLAHKEMSKTDGNFIMYLPTQVYLTHNAKHLYWHLFRTVLHLCWGRVYDWIPMASGYISALRLSSRILETNGGPGKTPLLRKLWSEHSCWHGDVSLWSFRAVGGSSLKSWMGCTGWWDGVFPIATQTFLVGPLCWKACFETIKTHFMWCKWNCGH